jgi:hypothetical protein
MCKARASDITAHPSNAYEHTNALRQAGHCYCRNNPHFRADHFFRMTKSRGKSAPLFFCPRRHFGVAFL